MFKNLADLKIWEEKQVFSRLNFITQIVLVVRIDCKLIGSESEVNSEVICERKSRRAVMVETVSA